MKIPRHTVLKGERRELVNLLWPDFEKPPSVLLEGTGSFGLEDLTLYAHKHEHIIRSGTIDRPGEGNIFLRKVRIRANLYYGHMSAGGVFGKGGKFGPEESHKRLNEFHRLSPHEGHAVTLGGPNIEITDCDFYVSGPVFHLVQTSDSRRANNTLHLGRWAGYRISDSNRVIIDNALMPGCDTRRK